MNSFFARKLSAETETRRIEMLFDRLPSTVVVSLIGIFLCFLVLFGTVALDLLKVWTAYMLSVLAMRAGIWYLFRKADRRSETAYRWEWACAFGAFVSGLGWGALFGPLYPPATHPDTQMFVALMVVITAFTGSVFVAQSNVTFWLFIVPVLTPAIVHYTATLGYQAQWPVTAAACCIAVFVIVQRTLYRSATSNLARSTQAETLLAEQQAILEHCRETGTWILADEVYERLYYEGDATAAPSFLDIAAGDRRDRRQPRGQVQHAARRAARPPHSGSHRFAHGRSFRKPRGSHPVSRRQQYGVCPWADSAWHVSPEARRRHPVLGRTLGTQDAGRDDA